jgi:hypothetical protein
MDARYAIIWSMIVVSSISNYRPTASSDAGRYPSNKLQDLAHERQLYGKISYCISYVKYL